MLYGMNSGGIFKGILQSFGNDNSNLHMCCGIIGIWLVTGILYGFY